MQTEKRQGEKATKEKINETWCIPVLNNNAYGLLMFMIIKHGA